jgi:hypothetical protein
MATRENCAREAIEFPLHACRDDPAAGKHAADAWPESVGRTGPMSLKRSQLLAWTGITHF